MYTYIKYNIKGKYVEFPEQLKPRLYPNVGNSYQDYLAGKWVLLTEDQLAFRTEHPDASVKEVFEMNIQEPIIYERTLEDAKNEMKAMIEKYDGSSDVNSFYIQGMEVWLDKATRTGLKLRFEAEKAKKQLDTTLWYNGIQFPLNLENAFQMLYDIEIYASACYDNTQRHLTEVEKLETIEEVDKYDYTTGYPEKLNF